MTVQQRMLFLFEPSVPLLRSKGSMRFVLFQLSQINILGGLLISS